MNVPDDLAMLLTYAGAVDAPGGAGLVEVAPDIFQVPFYYVEYGLAQLCAVQIRRNALGDPAGAVARYRYALALGCTAPLPDLYNAAGACFAFDVATLREAVELIERTIEELEDELA